MTKKIIILLFLSFLILPIKVDAKDFPNPLGQENITPEIVIGNVIKAVLGIVGALALLMFVYGGLLWMTAAGAPERVTKGKDTLMWAALGLVIIFASYVLVKFVIDSLLGAG